MYSETLCFENSRKQKHFVFIAETTTTQDWMNSLTKEFALMKTNGKDLKYPLMSRIQHSAFYENELHPNSLMFIFLKPLKLLLFTPLQLSIMIMYRDKLSFKEVMIALNLTEGNLKKLTNQILRKTGDKKIKTFFTKP